MADYEKMTVANLRVLLKDRGIPSTGLSRKAQIVARLQEEDAAAEKSAEPQDEIVAPEEEAPEVADAPETASAEDALVQESPSPEHEDKQEETSNEPQIPVTEPDNVIDQAKIEPSKPTDAEPTTTQEPSSPLAQPSQATRSLSQTPLPSKEEAIRQPTPRKSIDSSPALTRENTAVTARTDSEERLKRKRRSGSPTIDTQELAIKRARVAEEVHLKEDGIIRPPSGTAKDDVVMSEGGAVQAPELNEQAGKDQGVEGRDMADALTHVQTEDRTASDKHLVQSEKEIEATNTKPSTKQPKDNRYQELISTDQSTITATPVAVNDLPTPPPAIHVATTALYVRNFMRPLQVPSLKSHVLSLARNGDEDTIKLLYVDSVRTHAFIIVSSLAAAARIRAGLHDQIWPKERDRKPLWADYVPAEQVSKWIDAEESSIGGPRPGGRKWEVVYDHADGAVTARHAEVGATNAVPSGPKMSQHEGRAPSISQPTNTKDSAAGPVKQPEAAAESFIALDKLFKSTKAKPMLYFMPVETKLADKRLDEIEDTTAKRWSSRDWKENDELRRYTFEDDRLVDSGRHNVQRRGAESGRGGPPSRYGRGPPSRGAYRGHRR